MVVSTKPDYLHSITTNTIDARAHNQISITTRHISHHVVRRSCLSGRRGGIEAPDERDSVRAPRLTYAPWPIHRTGISSQSSEMRYARAMRYPICAEPSRTLLPGCS